MFESAQRYFCTGRHVVAATLLPILAFSAHAASEFVYVANAQVGGGISSYEMDPTTGKLTSLGEIADGDFPASLVAAPNGAFIYVGNQNRGSVGAYGIEPISGKLTQLDVSPVPAGGNPLALTIAPDGRFVYATNYLSNNISAYKVDVDTGGLSSIPGASYPTGASPYGIAATPSGGFFYVANNLSNDLIEYSADRKTGVLTQKGTVAAGLAPTAIAVAPSGLFLYVTNVNSNDVMAYSIDPITGSLALTGIFPAGSGPVSIAIAPNGAFLYVASVYSNDVTAYKVDVNTGKLTIIAATTKPNSAPRGVQISGSGTFAYVINGDLNTISAYSVGSNGGLTFVEDYPTGTFPYGIAITPRSPSRFLTFPLKDLTPGTAAINSIMDHSVVTDEKGPHFYKSNENGVITAYTGEVGLRNCGRLKCVVDAPKTPSFAQRSGRPFKTNGHYLGGTHNDFLSYEGHAGFDYPAAMHTPIFAPMDGVAYIPDKDVITSEWDPKTAVSKFNIMAVDHLNGYVTWYMHVGDNTTGADYRKIQCSGEPEVKLSDGPVSVKRGCRIGFTGDKGLANPGQPGPPHLHFEVRVGVVLFGDPVNGTRGCNRPSCFPVDPYGWAPLPSAASQQNDPYTPYPCGQRLWVDYLDEYIVRPACSLQTFAAPTNVVLQRPDQSLR